MIINTKFLTPSLLLPITTTTVTTNIVSLDIVFFHTARTDALSKGNSCFTKSTCSYYCISLGVGGSYQQYTSGKYDLLNLVSCCRYEDLAGGTIHHLLTDVSVYKVSIFCHIRPLICMIGIIFENIRIISNPIIVPAQLNAEESLLYL
jgi:hypothetical protein